MSVVGPTYPSLCMHSTPR